MPHGRGRRPERAGRRRSSVGAGIPARAWWILAATALAVVTLAVLLEREHVRAQRTTNGFPPEDIEAASFKILPYRKSGLIFSWGHEEPTVYVARAMWEALSEDVQRDLGQAMAIAKDQKQVRIRDGKSREIIAICTAAGRCRKPSVESSSQGDEDP